MNAQMKKQGFDEGKTPKKRNTSSKKIDKSNAASLVFRMDDPTFSTTPANMRVKTDDDDSPTMMDLIGADTPTAEFLLNSMENVILDEGLLTRHLRGQDFTPLPNVLGDDVNFAITPNLSWSINGSPLNGLGLTPRFGLDSTKSRKNPLASPKSFWKDDFLEEVTSTNQKLKSSEQESGGVKSILSMLSPAMRELDAADPSLDGGPTSPIPIQSKMEAPKSNIECIATPLRVPPRGPPAEVPSASQPIPRRHHHGSPWRADHRGPPGYTRSPIPNQPHHHPHHGMSPYRREGYGTYPPHHHRYNPDDRIRNLRGRGPPLHHMPPQHHLPPPSYHHFSPLTNVPPRPRWQHANQMRANEEMASSKCKCIPARPPIPAKFQGDMEKYKDATVPDFNHLVNFPGNINSKTGPCPDGMRCCVMCGQACPCSQGGKVKKGDMSIKSVPSSGSTVAPSSNAQGTTNKNSSTASTTGNGYAIIPTQNKGLCTLCDVNVWIVTQTGLEIKWCKGCKNFRPWAAFGDKGLATKCVRCRERQREKYALQKEEKDRARSSHIKKASSSGPVEPKSMGPV